MEIKKIRKVLDKHILELEKAITDMSHLKNGDEVEKNHWNRMMEFRLLFTTLNDLLAQAEHKQKEKELRLKLEDVCE